MLALHNVHIVGQGLRDITLDGGRIVSVRTRSGVDELAGPKRLHFTRCIALPGLINSHDHLHFNLFPQLGHRTYADYVEWGREIHALDHEAIAAVLRVPEALRTRWGLYKNLLNGVTTVVHHGERLPLPQDLIEVFQRCHSLHSVRQERRWRWRLNHPRAGRRPVVIHAGEGTNASARREIDSLIRWNLFQRPLVAVHGVAMVPEQARNFAALVWCPASNDFLFKATADIPRLAKHTAILFGSDSTLTASWSLWEQLRFARSLGLMRDDALLASLTTTPAQVWGMTGKGQIGEGFQADIVIARTPTDPDRGESWFEMHPGNLALVMQAGRILLCDEERFQQATKAGALSGPFSKVVVGGEIKHVKGDLPGLIAAIRGHLPQAILPVQPAE